MATPERANDKVAKWLWWVLIASSLVVMFFFWWMQWNGQEKALAQNPVLAIVAKCQPKDFDSPEKVSRAAKLYQEEGLLPWHGSMTCWESLITKEMLPVKLAVVEAPIGNNELSQEIRTPRISGTFSDWPLASETCEIVPDGDKSKKLPCQKAIFASPLRFFQFHSTGPKPEKVEVVVRQ